jgi:hypothetical protein
MDEVARRACFLLLAYRHPLSFISDFWQRFHGEPRWPLPGALEALNALYQLGIAAQMTLIPIPSRFSYAGEDEALADIRWRLRFPPDPDRDQAIRMVLHELLIREDDGTLAPRDLAPHAAVIWWEHETEALHSA